MADDPDIALSRLTAHPTRGTWEVYRCKDAEADQACGIRVVGSNTNPNDPSIATMVVSDTNREECCHALRLADAMHICALHNYTSVVFTMKANFDEEKFAKFKEQWTREVAGMNDAWKTPIVAVVEEPPLNPAEAVWGLLGWLTTRETPATFSRCHNANEAVELATQFIEANKLGDVSANWPRNLTHPESKNP